MFGQPLGGLLARDPRAGALGGWTADRRHREGHRRRGRRHQDPLLRARRGRAPGLLVYFHGGGHVIGSIGIMDNIARELREVRGRPGRVGRVPARAGAPVPPGARRLRGGDARGCSPTRTSRFGVPGDAVVVGGESAGGNLAAAVSLRPARAPTCRCVDRCCCIRGPTPTARRSTGRGEELVGVVLSRATMIGFWERYSGGREPQPRYRTCARSAAETLAGLPPAIVVLGGADPLRERGAGVRRAACGTRASTWTRCASRGSRTGS